MRPARLVGLVVLALAILAAGMLIARLSREERSAALPSRDVAGAPRAHDAALAPSEAPPGPRTPSGSASDAESATPKVEQLVLAILDPDGSPLAGARVVVFTEADILGKAVTDEAGEARFQVWKEKGEVAVWSPSVPAHRQTLEVLADRHVIQLAHGTAVAGLVLVNGQPATEPFEVLLESDSQVRPTEFFSPEVRAALGIELKGFDALRAPVGEDGRFRFSGLPTPWSGRIRWEADLYPVDGSYDPWDEPQRELALADAREDVVLDLAAAGVITARFVDAAGEPIVPSTVSLDTPWAERFSGADPSGPDGAYHARVQLPLPDDITLTVYAFGHTPYTVPFRRPASAVALWDLGDVVVPPEQELRVKVHDELGQAIAGATVGQWNEALTDAAGIAAIGVRDVVAGVPVEHPDYAPMSAEAPGDLRATLEVTLRRKAYVFLDFEVLPAGSEEGLRATLEPGAVGSGTLSGLADGHNVVPAGLPLRLRLTDRLGRMVHEELLPPLAPGETAEHHVQLDWQPATLSLRTFDSAGFPLPHAAVLLDGNRLWTEPDGTLELGALAPGPLAVAVVHPSHVQRTLSGVVLGPESVPFEVHLAHR